MKRISPKHIRKPAGFTLIEIMMTVAIAVIVLSIGVPSFQTMIQNNRKTTAINDLRTALALARSTAISRRVRVTVCKSSDHTDCADSGDWSQGWIVFADPNNPGDVDDDEEILRVHEAVTIPDGSFSGNGTVVTRVSFTPQGMFDNGVGGTLTYTDARGSEYSGNLVISAGGMVRYQEGSGSSS